MALINTEGISHYKLENKWLVFMINIIPLLLNGSYLLPIRLVYTFYEYIYCSFLSSDFKQREKLHKKASNK